MLRQATTKALFTKAGGIKNRPSAKTRGIPKSLRLEIIPNLGSTLKTLQNSFVRYKRGRSNFCRIFVIIKYNTELCEFLYCEGQDCARPSSANWTSFNAARLRTPHHRLGRTPVVFFPPQTMDWKIERYFRPNT
jgi:hypothetical protein